VKPMLMLRRLILLLLLTLLLQPSIAGTFSQIGTSRWVTVAYVYDGDTFRTGHGERVRLLGINTPEIAHNDSPGEPLGESARRRLSSLLLNHSVKLSFDNDRKDRYGRTLAHVYLRDGSWINAEMIREGLAHLYLFAPNYRHAEELLALEQTARSKRIGIWKTDRFAPIDSGECDSSLAGQFRVVSGHITSISRNGWGFSLGKLNVSIPRRYRAFFKSPPKLKMSGNVTVHGTIRVYSGKRLYLALHSPFDLEIITQ